MTRRKGKAVSFDAMVKFFLQNYNIPTTKDVEKLIARIERLENAVKNSGVAVSSRTKAPRRTNRAAKAGGAVASDTVLDIIGCAEQGIGVPEIQKRTGFGEKKLRNIIFRLHKIGKIKRVSRGTYTVS